MKGDIAPAVAFSTASLVLFPFGKAARLTQTISSRATVPSASLHPPPFRPSPLLFHSRQRISWPSLADCMGSAGKWTRTWLTAGSLCSINWNTCGGRVCCRTCSSCCGWLHTATARLRCSTPDSTSPAQKGRTDQETNFTREERFQVWSDQPDASSTSRTKQRNLMFSVCVAIFSYFSCLQFQGDSSGNQRLRVFLPLPRWINPWHHHVVGLRQCQLRVYSARVDHTPKNEATYPEQAAPHRAAPPEGKIAASLLCPSGPVSGRTNQSFHEPF